MNKIYKVIWNKAKHCYVVASELAKRNTKGSGARSLGRAAVTLGIVAGLTVGMTGSAWAEEIPYSYDLTINSGTNVTIAYQFEADKVTLTFSATDTTYSAGDGISIGTGTTPAISVKAGDGIKVDTNGVQVQLDETSTEGSHLNLDENGLSVKVGAVADSDTGIVTGGKVYEAVTDGSIDIKGKSLSTVGDKFVADVDGGILAADGKFVVDGSGNTVAAGTLDVTGATTLKDTLDVTGATTLKDTLDVTGATTLGSTLDVTGAATLKDTLDVTGATTLKDTLDVTGATTLGSTLDVTGATTLKDTLDVTGATTLDSTLDVTGAATLKDTLDVTGATTLKDTLTVEKAATLNDTLTVKGDTELQSNLKVGGEALFNEGKTNQIKIDESGIRIGLHSGQIDDEGFYAGGHTWDEAMAAMGADGRIKGTEFIVNGKTYIDKEGLNANHQKIRNLAPGDITPTSTDAINGTQMYELSQELRKVGAGAAAMANLRPVDMGNRFSVALGVGGYRDEKAMAAGLFYRPTDRIMINMSGTVGNSNNMIGGGISFALDKSVKPVGGADNAEIKALKAENAEIKAELAELKAAIKAMKAAK